MRFDGHARAGLEVSVGLEGRVGLAALAEDDAAGPFAGDIGRIGLIAAEVLDRGRPRQLQIAARVAAASAMDEDGSRIELAAIDPDGGIPAVLGPEMRDEAVIRRGRRAGPRMRDAACPKMADHHADARGAVVRLAEIAPGRRRGRPGIGPAPPIGIGLRPVVVVPRPLPFRGAGAAGHKPIIVSPALPEARQFRRLSGLPGRRRGLCRIDAPVFRRFGAPGIGLARAIDAGLRCRQVACGEGSVGRPGAHALDRLVRHILPAGSIRLAGREGAWPGRRLHGTRDRRAGGNADIDAAAEENVVTGLVVQGEIGAVATGDGGGLPIRLGKAPVAFSQPRGHGCAPPRREEAVIEIVDLDRLPGGVAAAPTIGIRQKLAVQALAAADGGKRPGRRSRRLGADDQPAGDGGEPAIGQVD